ncbi:MAG: tRNA (N(6)-L-threonylcarbamoyladenosine(37)-C(2))-methylthiotransferase MtaB [Bacteroidia bacterium]|nr:tRNA (N(6)-L-threonylcarbamoyladenosine(37)-C(2))-methylthiotransferase MtaB [Bacteroidia bacterium]
MNTVAFHTLGCKLNFSETSTIGREFLNAGFEKVAFEEKADVYVINTCSVTEEANKKCRYTVRNALSRNPGAYIVVMGCYAQLKPYEIAEIPGVDLVVGAKDKFRVVELIGDMTKHENPCVFNSGIQEVNVFKDAFSMGDRTRSYLKIQDGCDYKCTFCTIPLARGKSRSDSLENIIRNAKEIAKNGIKEIVIAGVNIGDYGKDQPHTFMDVIRELDKVEGIERIRISSIEPNLLTAEIIRFVAESRRFMPHFHIPLQSGNDEILGNMRRRYKRALYAERVEMIKKVMPHACIGVDVIVGFPGETKAHFLDTYQFLNELDIAYLHVFPYSERENTPAAEMEGVVPRHERAERNKMLRILSDKKRMEFYRKFENTAGTVLWEAEKEGSLMFGFTENYIKVMTPYREDWVNQTMEVVLDKVTADGWVTVTPEIVAG